MSWRRRFGCAGAFRARRLGRDFVMTFSSGVGVAVGVADEETSTIGVATGVETGSGGGGVGAGVAFILGNGVGSIGISVGGPLPRRLGASCARSDGARTKLANKIVQRKNFIPIPLRSNITRASRKYFSGSRLRQAVVCRLIELDERPCLHLVCPTSMTERDQAWRRG